MIAPDSEIVTTLPPWTIRNVDSNSDLGANVLLFTFIDLFCIIEHIYIVLLLPALNSLWT